jgi:hypothetical protein
MGGMAPAVKEDGIVFQVWPNDHCPPHVHVYVDGEDIRINLLTDEFMDAPPPGRLRQIREAYRKHKDKLVKWWKQFEPRQR